MSENHSDLYRPELNSGIIIPFIMHNNLTISAVLLAVLVGTVSLFAAQTVPPQTPEKRITTGDTGQSGAEINHRSAAAVDAATGEVENLKIQKELAVFTGLLVLVGGLQVFTMIWQARLSRGALREIHDQAKQMGRQTKILEDSVAAAKVSAEAASKQVQMMKDKERARLRVEFDDLDLTPNPEKGPYFDAYLVRYKLVLDGLTQAYVVDAHCFAGIWVDGKKPRTQDERLYWTGMMIPEVITPAIGVVKGFTALQEEGFSATIDAGDERIRLVREGKLHVYCEGSITYKDVFDGVWETKFQRKWNYFIAASEAADRIRGRWHKCGGTNANGERRSAPGC